MTDRSPTTAAEHARGLDRRSVLGLGLGATGLALTAGGPEAIAASTRGLSNGDVLALYRLKANYAFGTDAIGAGDFDRGLALYRQVFAPNAQIAAGFDEATPALEAVGPDAYAELVRGAVVGTLGSQHFLGTFGVEAGPGRRGASITAYFQATVLAAADKTITTYLGAYHDEARRRGRRWLITKSFAKYLSIEASARTAP